MIQYKLNKTTIIILIKNERILDFLQNTLLINNIHVIAEHDVYMYNFSRNIYKIH